MIRKLQDLVILISRTWWLYLIVTALAFGSLSALTRIGAIFPEHAAGSIPFDLQNGLTMAQVYQQLAGYTPEARRLYYGFTLIDYAFPFFAGLFTAATVAFLLRNSRPRWYDALTSRNLLPIFMIATLFDWLENVAAVTAMDLYPTEIGWLPALLVLAKRCKLAFVFLGQGSMLVLLIFAAGQWLVRKVRGR